MASNSATAINSLRVRNYRALKDVEFKNLSPFTVILGANGSGKSTIFDVFAFLNEAFTEGLRAAWDRRNRISGIRTVGERGAVVFELKYRTEYRGKMRLATYTLGIDDDRGSPVVVEERLTWTVSPGSGRPKDILRFHRGEGKIWDEDTAQETQETLASADLLAVTALGQFLSHPRIKFLRDFVSSWYLSYVSADNTRTTPVSGPEGRLSKSGDNLPNVIQYLQENHAGRLVEIFDMLGERVPQVEKVESIRLADGRLLLRLKDRAFPEPVLSRFASDGTLKLLAYLTVLMDPDPARVIGIEEPENQLHPKLLPVLAEEMRAITNSSQVFVTTHSPDFVNAVRPEELWMIGRGADGFTSVARANRKKDVLAMVAAGATLGDLWSERYLLEADPAGVV